MSIQFKEVVRILTHFNTSSVKNGTKKVDKLVDSKYTEFWVSLQVFGLYLSNSCDCSIN